MIIAAFGAFILMIAMMLIGIPIAVSMFVVGAVGGFLAYGRPYIDSVASVVWGVQNENLLTSIPLFILLGELLLRSGIADRMYVTMAAWLGRLPGGLLHTNIGCCALFAATSGSSVATAATIGTVALPALHARNYSMRDSLGSIAAGGTLGILIPPSVNMIVYGSLTNNSIGKLFIAGIIPGILLSLLFMLYIYVSSILKGSARQEVLPPLAERIRLLSNLVAPAVVFGIVMGSLYFGIATTTESAALGVIAALFFAWQTKRLSFELLRNCFLQTARISGMILLIIVAAFILNYRLSPRYGDNARVMDGKRAIQVIRSRAAEWKLDPHRVGFIGFSAGSSLGRSVASASGAGEPNASDPVDRFNSRPDYLGLVYGPGSAAPGESLKNFPPAFLMVAAGDKSVALDSARLCMDLINAGAIAELHIYQKGNHGFGSGFGSGTFSDWMPRLEHFLKQGGFLPGGKP